MNCPIPLRALVVDQESRLTKNGDLFWQVILKTKVGTIKAFMWDAPKDVDKNPAYPHIGDIIEIDAFKDQLEERKSIVVNTWHRIRKSDLPQEDACILEFESAAPEEIQAAWAFIDDDSFWENTNNHRFIIYCLDKFGRDKIEKCPAAAKVHHQYAGGLLVHTGEVLALCKSYVETTISKYSFINKDVVYASAILHDIGKVETYRFNELGVAQQTPVEKTIGHIFCGMSKVRSAFEDGMADVDPQFITELLHCIAAHHGTREWGSIVEPQSLEAGIVSRLDYLSSRNGMMEKLLSDSIRSGQPLQDEFRVYGDPYFASIGIKRYISEGQIE